MATSISSFKWLAVAQDVYNDYLSKPYTLGTETVDWDYTYANVTIQRPNHGLAHTLRTAIPMLF